MVSSREVIGLAVRVLDAVDPVDPVVSFDLPAWFRALVTQPGPTAGRPVGAQVGVRSTASAEPDRLATDILPLVAALERQLQPMIRARSSVRAETCGGSSSPALTAREAEALGLLAAGLTAGATARRMGCSLSTANKHLGNVYRKLGVGDRLGAVLEAQRRGMVAVDGPADAVRGSQRLDLAASGRALTTSGVEPA